MTGDPRARRGRATLRIAAWSATGLLLILVGILATVRIALQGERLAGLLMHRLPRLQGRIELGGVHWTFPAAIALMRGHAAPLHVRGLRVLDPEGTLVLDVPDATITLELHRHGREVIVHSARLGRVGWRFASMRTRQGIGFITAFMPEALGRPGISADGSTRSSIALQDVHWDDLDAVFDFPTWGLELRRVRGGGWLHAGTADPTRPPSLTFDTGGEALEGGLLRVMNGPGRIELPFDHAVLPHVSVLKDRPADLYLEVAEARTGSSRLRGAGFFTHLIAFRTTGPPGVTVTFGFEQAADAVAAVLRQRGLRSIYVNGRQARISAKLDGPFIALGGVLNVAGLDVSIAGRRLHNLELDAEASGTPRSLKVAPLRFQLPGGGRVQLTASLDASLQARAELRVERASLKEWTPRWLQSRGVEKVDGTATAVTDLRRRTTTLSSLDLSLLRKDGSRALLIWGGPDSRRSRPAPDEPALHVAGLSLARSDLRIDDLSLVSPLGEVHASGRIPLRRTAGERGRPPMRMTFAASGLDLGALVRSPALSGRVSLRGQARGTPHQLNVTAVTAPGSKLRILGESYRLPSRILATLRDGRAQLPTMELSASSGARLRIGGELGPRGIDMTATMEGHRLARLPWVATTRLPVSGTLGGDLRLHGRPPRPTATGEIRLASIVVGKVHLGDGTLHLAPRGDGLAVVGRVFDRFDVDGLLSLGPDGPQARMRLGFRDLPLGPLLPATTRVRDLQVVATGTLSGHVGTARSPVLELTLQRLDAAFTVAAARGPRRVSLRSEEPLRARAEAMPAQLVIEPMRLRTDAGPLEAALTLRPDRIQGFVRGSLELALLQPLFDRRGPRLDGVVQTVLAAEGSPARPSLNGRLLVATPLRAILPGHDTVDVTAGQLTLTPAEGGTEIAVRGVSARWNETGPLVLGPAGGPAATLVVRSLSPFRLGRVDVPVSARDLRFAQGGLRAGDLDLDLRLHGDASRQLALTGSLAVSEATLRGGVPKAGKPSGQPGALDSHPVLANTTLDVRVHTPDGGVLIERRFIPDFRVAVDARVRGTLRRPQVSFDVTSPDYFGRLALELYGLWRSL